MVLVLVDEEDLCENASDNEERSLAEERHVAGYYAGCES